MAGAATPVEVSCGTCQGKTTSFDEKCTGCGSQLSPSPSVRMARARHVELQAAYDAVVTNADAARIDALATHVRKNGRIVVNIRSSTVRDMLEHPSVTY